MQTLITGATGGLGRAFVYECAKRGDDLILTGQNPEKLEKIVSDVTRDFPAIKVASKRCDLSSEQSRIEFFNYLKENNLKVDMLINNAGYIAEGDFLAHSEQEILKIIRVNCEGTVDFTQKTLRMRDKDKPLNILTVASLAGYYPMPHMAIYASTKAFLKSLMIALSIELKDKNVFITTVCPSGIPTTDAMKEAIKAQGAGGKMTMSLPEEVAKEALRGMAKHKTVVVPKAINRFINAMGKLCSEKQLAKIAGKRWKKAQEKRNFNNEEK